MKKRQILICLVIIVCLFFNGLPCTAHQLTTQQNTDYWAVVIVSLAESKQPYLYNSLLKSKNWKEDHIKLLWKEEATKENIFFTIEWLNMHADSNDIILLSVDSHGTYDGQSYGIYPWDGYENGFISIEELDAEIDKIDAKGSCLVFDCCFSGSFIDENQSLDKRIVNNNINPEIAQTGIEGENRVVIMGTMPNALGLHWYAPLLNTEITPTTMLAEAFAQKYDENNDHITSAEEGFSYLKNHFRKWALRGFCMLPVQIIYYLMYGFFIKPFPTIFDSFSGELPLIIH
jgi:hypothetical protein